MLGRMLGCCTQRGPKRYTGQDSGLDAGEHTGQDAGQDTGQDAGLPQLPHTTAHSPVLGQVTVHVAQHLSTEHTVLSKQKHLTRAQAGTAGLVQEPQRSVLGVLLLDMAGTPFPPEAKPGDAVKCKFDNQTPCWGPWTARPAFDPSLSGPAAREPRMVCFPFLNPAIAPLWKISFQAAADGATGGRGRHALLLFAMLLPYLLQPPE